MRYLAADVVRSHLDFVVRNFSLRVVNRVGGSSHRFVPAFGWLVSSNQDSASGLDEFAVASLDYSVRLRSIRSGEGVSDAEVSEISLKDSQEFSALVGVDPLDR